MRPVGGNAGEHLQRGHGDAVVLIAQQVHQHRPTNDDDNDNDNDNDNDDDDDDDNDNDNDNDNGNGKGNDNDNDNDNDDDDDDDDDDDQWLDKLERLLNQRESELSAFEAKLAAQLGEQQRQIDRNWELLRSRRHE